MPLPLVYRARVGLDLAAGYGYYEAQGAGLGEGFLSAVIGTFRDYNPQPGLHRIEAVLLAINSADDERNPPELGVLEREIKRVKNGRVLLIPGSEETAGHGTTARARFWKDELAKLLQSAARRGS